MSAENGITEQDDNAEKLGKSVVTEFDDEDKNEDPEDGEDDDQQDDDEDEEEDEEFDEEYDDEGDEDLTAKLNELRDMMGNIYMGQNQYSTIDITLNKPEFELEELLEQDDFLPDLRRGKVNLMSYLAPVSYTHLTLPTTPYV
eukprot:TRINITY_DN545_c0_g1_i1.p1 TRINITY_DN545_c0_g1~~TRINITY_DN545_c0_g1_i1.p1  ORF type:complete len:143 (+),score=45.36 TRINITY_DN545_c0_g1_i1:147-575(+)